MTGRDAIEAYDNWRCLVLKRPTIRLEEHAFMSGWAAAMESVAAGEVVIPAKGSCYAATTYWPTDRWEWTKLKGNGGEDA